MQIITHEEALTILARSVDPRDPSSMLEAVQLLGGICLVPPDGWASTHSLSFTTSLLTPLDWKSTCISLPCSDLHIFILPSHLTRHDKVLEGITVCGEMREQERFAPIVQGVVMDDPNMKVRVIDVSYMLHNTVRVHHFVPIGIYFIWQHSMFCPVTPLSNLHTALVNSTPACSWSMLSWRHQTTLTSDFIYETSSWGPD